MPFLRLLAVPRALRALVLLATLASAPSAWAQTQRLTLPDVVASNVYSGSFFQGGRFADDGAVLRYVEANDDGTTDLVALDLETDTRTVLLKGTDLTAADVSKRIGIEDYTYSGDGNRVLLFTDSSPVWRYNTQGYYYVYDRTTRRLTPVGSREAGTQLFAKLSPDGQKVGFVRNRNLYVRDLATGRETALTTTGAPGTLIHGTTDWVYEEEFGLRDAWQWSPDGRQIAFLTFDEAKEESFTMQDLRTFYPTATTFRYPKAGTANAEVQLGVADVAAGTVRYFDTDTWYEGGNDTEYLPQFGWTPAIGGASKVWAFRMNRDQNVLDLLYADPATMAVRTVLTERADAWIETETGFSDLTGGTITYLNDGKHFIWLSERDGFRQLYLYRTDGTLVRPLTTGRYDVTGFLGADEAGGYVYYVAAYPTPMERNVMRLRVSFADAAPAAPARGRTRGSARGRTTPAPRPVDPERITTAPGTHSAELSRDRRFLIVTHSTITQPPVVTLRRTDGTVVKTLEGNAALISRLANTRLPRVRFTMVPGAGRDSLRAWVMTPQTFDPSKKHPVLMYVYGGPGSQTVTDAWGGSRALWHMYLAEELGVVVVSVDNRGTGARGYAFKTATYKRLGVVEAEDQIAAAQYIGRQSWADASRIGIWGWSYGGFMTLNSLLMGEGPQTFKVGMAVAPVTDWKQYDTIYTERFLLTPQVNADGYREGSPLTYADRLAPMQKLFIAHGDLDDNVHLQNTTQMIDRLQTAGKRFDMMLYPGKNHGITGRATRLHLFGTMTDYVRQHLVGERMP